MIIASFCSCSFNENFQIKFSSFKERVKDKTEERERKKKAKKLCLYVKQSIKRGDTSPRRYMQTSKISYMQTRMQTHLDRYTATQKDHSHTHARTHKDTHTHVQRVNRHRMHSEMKNK